MKVFCLIFSLIFGLFLQGANLLLDSQGKLCGTPPGKGIAVQIHDGAVDVTIGEPSRQWNCILPVSPEMKFLRVRMKMKSEKVKPGKEAWENARLGIRFRNREHKEVGAWPATFHADGTTGWVECDRLYAVPEGAVECVLSPANFGMSGVVRFFDLRVEEVRSVENLDLDVPPPDGSTPEAAGSIEDAARETTPTRERVCLNGLWEFRPLYDGETAGPPPPRGSGWGYFKVPGAWPTHDNGMRFHLSALVRPRLNLKTLNSAWYRRTFTVPDSWTGRGIALSAELIQSCAKVFVDGKEAGEIYYPGNTVDLTGKLIPGKTQTLTLLVSARPEKSQVFMAPGRLISLDENLTNRGITGDLYLESFPREGAFGDVHVITSVEKGEIGFDCGFAGLPAGEYRMAARVSRSGKVVKEFACAPFRSDGKSGFRHTFGGKWENPELWDIDAPENLYVAELQLFSADGVLLDQFRPQEFGFREFSIRGRDFYLNGRKIHLRMLVSGAPQKACYGSEAWMEKQVETARRFGANFLIGWNYSFTAGIFCYPAGFHEVASRRGMLTSLTLPHVKDFKANLDDPVQAEAYRRQCEHLIRRFQNVPGVVMYVMNHNSMGYPGDQNPLRIGTSYRPEEVLLPSATGYRAQASRAEAIAKQLDATRPVYHHESGNLGDVYTINCYLNWAPRQERSDWLEHWEKNGTMPLMFVEWGLPHIASWSSYRGPSFIWSGNVLQCIWFNEHNAAMLGEEAYRADAAKSELYAHQEKLVKGNRNSSFSALGSHDLLNRIEDVHRVRAFYARRNFRDLRWRGISGLLPWDQFTFAQWEGRKEGVGENPDRFTNLKRPGLVPDYFFDTGDCLHNVFSNYSLTTTGRAIVPNFGDCLAWIGGAAGDITENGHNFRPGETVRKTIAVLNDGRREVNVEWRWEVAALQRSGSGSLVLDAGERKAVPVEFQIPAGMHGEAVIEATAIFSGGKEFRDRMAFEVIGKSPLRMESKVGVFDPEGDAVTLLKNAGVAFRKVVSDADLDGIELLVVGRNALEKNPLHLSRKLEAGLKLLVLEQPTSVFDRLGLRSNEQGFREIFSLSPEFKDMRDWRGSATQLPAYFPPPPYERSAPRWNWNGFSHTRVWRAGNRGAITEVVVEKPAVGNWLPLLEAGFDLQYAPLLEFSEGRGRILFCQAAVSGRTETEPEAEELFRKALLRLDRARPEEPREVFYAGGKEGAELLRTLGVPFRPFATPLPERALLVLGPGASVPNLSEAVTRGCHVLALGLNRAELEKVLPGAFDFESGAFDSDFVENLRETPQLAGIGNAELHWRGKMTFDGFAGNSLGRALAVRTPGKGCLVAVQLPPWKFDAEEFYYRTTRRRSAFLVSRLLANLGARFRTVFFSLLDGVKGNSRFELPNDRWLGKADPEGVGRDAGWWKPQFHPDGSWRNVQLPGTFESQFADLADYDGCFWYRLEFDLPAEGGAQSAELLLGAIDDESWVWLNGTFLGEITRKTNPKDYWTAVRSYSLKPGVLKAGRNVLIVLCNDIFNTGGILGVPQLRFPVRWHFYADLPQSGDNPYQYFRW